MPQTPSASTQYIAYQQQGQQGPWLVLVHGLTCDRRDWQYQLETLASEYRCLVVDLRGHGRSHSMAMPGPYSMQQLGADLHALLQHLDVEAAVLAGHSMGTRVITEAALCDQHSRATALPGTYTQRIKSLVFIDGSRQASAENPPSASTLDPLREDAAAYRNFMSDTFEQMFDDSLPNLYREDIIRRAVTTPATILTELIFNMWQWDAHVMPDAIAALQCPMHIVQSTFVNQQRQRVALSVDEYSPYVRQLLEWQPHAEVMIIPGVGHFTQIDAPEQINQLLIRALT